MSKSLSYLRYNRLSSVLLPVALVLGLSACGGGDSDAPVSAALPSPNAATPSVEADNAQLQSQIDDINAKLKEAYAKLKEGEAKLASQGVTKPQDTSTDKTASTQTATTQKSDSKSTDKFAELDKAIAATQAKPQSFENSEQAKSLQAEITKLKEQINTLNKEKDNLLKNGVTDEAVKKELEATKAELKRYEDKYKEKEEKEAAEKARAEAIAREQARQKQEINEKRLAAEKERIKTQPHSGTDKIFKALNDIKTKFEPGRDHYGGAVLSVNNKDNTAQAFIFAEEDYNSPAKGEIDAAFKQFKIGNTNINLLEKGSKFHLRELTAQDFPNGGFGSGIIGSKQDDWRFSGFGELRYGVYNDPQGNSHLFVYGNPSAATKHGSPNVDIVYRGSAIMGKDGKYRALPKAVTAVLDKNKTDLNISIKTDKNVTLEVPTTIKTQHKEFPIAGGAGKELGQKFSGENALMSANGALFGSAELGGFFAVKEGVHQGEYGVFGASFDSEYLKSDKEFEAALQNNEPK